MPHLVQYYPTAVTPWWTRKTCRLGPNEGRWYPAFRTLGPNAVRSWSPLSTPVADARWQGQGSEVSTHAAAAAWGLAAQMVKMWATEEVRNTWVRAAAQ